MRGVGLRNCCRNSSEACKRPTNPFLSGSVVWSPVSSGFKIPPDEVVHERVGAGVAWRNDWVQASGLTIAEASAELGVSAASVYRWQKLLAESPVPGRHPAGTGKRTAGATKSPRSMLPFLADARLRPGREAMGSSNAYHELQKMA